MRKKEEIQWFCDSESYGETYYNKHKQTFAYWVGGVSDKNEIIERAGGKSTAIQWFKEIVRHSFKNKIPQTNLWFHNLGNWDGFFFIEDLIKEYHENKQWTFTPIIEENKRILAMNVSYKKQYQEQGKRHSITYTFSFRDTARLWPLPLADLGEAIGYEKIEGYDYDLVDEFKNLADFKRHNNGESHKYAIRDITILKEFYRTTKPLMDISEAPYTIASSSLKDMVKENNDLKHYKWWVKEKWLWDEVNKAYIGGFTWVNPKYQLELLKIIYKYDVNSLYPYIMKEYAFPYGNPSFKDTPRHTYKLYNVRAKKVIAKSIPFYPFKNGLQKEFDIKEEVSQYEKEVENIDINVNNYMLEFLLQWYEFEDIEVKFIASWKEKFGLFSDFITLWEKLKISYDGINEGLRTITKLKQNSGYGKTGENPEKKHTKLMKKEEIIKSDTYMKTEKMEFYEGYAIERIPNTDWYYVREDKPLQYVEVKRPLPHNPDNTQETLLSSPIFIADKITTLARIHLLKDIIGIPNILDYLVYTDTDSVHSLIPLDDYLWIDKSEYGAWKYEGTVGEGIYRRAKHYLNLDTEFNGKVKPYLLKGGGFNVKRFNKSQEITKEQYLQREFTVKKGKLGKERVEGGILLRETDYKFTMPKWWENGHTDKTDIA